MLNGIYAGSQYQVRIQWDNGGKGLKTQKCCGRHKSSAYNQHANSRGELHVPVRVRGLLCVFRRAKFPADLGKRKEKPRERTTDRRRSSGRRRFNVDFQLRADYGLDHRASSAKEMQDGGCTCELALG